MPNKALIADLAPPFGRYRVGPCDRIFTYGRYRVGTCDRIYTEKFTMGPRHAQQREGGKGEGEGPRAREGEREEKRMSPRMSVALRTIIRWDTTRDKICHVGAHGLNRLIHESLLEKNMW